MKTTTPIYTKTDTDDNMQWPKDKLFYMIASNGMFLCRNHEWFESCVPAKTGPGELENQKPFVRIKFPKVPVMVMKKAVNFFRRVYEEHHWESALILVWNRHTNQMELVCPEQKCSYGGVNYTIPTLPQHLALIGDIHSHCNFSPEPSMIDTDDELNRPGLHIVAGYINKGPKFYCAIMVDGTRVKAENENVIEEPDWDDDASAIAIPDDVPDAWLELVTEKKWTYSYYGEGSSEWHSKIVEPDEQDLVKVGKILEGFSLRNKCPTVTAISSALFSATRLASFGWCDKRAEQFVKEWKQNEHNVKTQVTK